MTITHAKALGIGAAVLFFAAEVQESQAQGVVTRRASPLRAVANMVAGPQAAPTTAYYPGGYPTTTPYQTYAAPQPYAQGYTGWTTQQPAYAPTAQPTYPQAAQPAFRGYTTGQPTYTTNYYQSGYSGYTQPRTTTYPGQYQYPQTYQYVQPSTGNRYVDAARTIVQPNYQVAPVQPQTVPMFTVPR